MADMPVSSAPSSPKAEAIYEAHRDSDIDGHGDEGEGYDYDYFAQRLEDLGWVWKGEHTDEGS